MYDEKKLALMNKSLSKERQFDEDALEDLSHDDLRALRDQINAILPDESLSGMDMTTELMSQYRRVLKLQQTVSKTWRCRRTRRPRSRPRSSPRSETSSECRPSSIHHKG